MSANFLDDGIFLMSCLATESTGSNGAFKDVAGEPIQIPSRQGNWGVTGTLPSPFGKDVATRVVVWPWGTAAESGAADGWPTRVDIGSVVPGVEAVF